MGNGFRPPHTNTTHRCFQPSDSANGRFSLRSPSVRPIQAPVSHAHPSARRSCRDAIHRYSPIREFLQTWLSTLELESFHLKSWEFRLSKCGFQSRWLRKADFEHPQTFVPCGFYNHKTNLCQKCRDFGQSQSPCSPTLQLRALGSRVN